MKKEHTHNLKLKNNKKYEHILDLIADIFITLEPLKHSKSTEIYIEKSVIVQIQELNKKLKNIHTEDIHINKRIDYIPAIRFLPIINPFILYFIFFCIGILFTVIYSIYIKNPFLNMELVSLIIGFFIISVHFIVNHLIKNRRFNKLNLIYTVLKEIYLIIRINILGETVFDVLEGNPSLIETYKELSKKEILPHTNKLPKFIHLFG